MNRELARKVADAVLYEGYMLYPYRQTALKNRQRWSFGILYPPGYPEIEAGTERCAMRSECLVETGGRATFRIELRFLHLVRRERVFPAKGGTGVHDSPANVWDEGVERSVEFEHAPDCPRQEVPFGFPASFYTTPEQGAGPVRATTSAQAALTGELAVSAQRIHERALKLSIDVRNTTRLDSDDAGRGPALLRSLLSAHLILTACGADFVSMLDPPEGFREVAAACKNVGAFPVLVGTPGERDMLLCSPIILYDYPEIAPETTGDFFDATEIDEMLTLRVLTLTDDEKRQAKNSETRIRELLKRTERHARRQLTRTHGVVRNPSVDADKREE